MMSKINLVGSRRWSVVSGQWSVVSGQWSVVKINYFELFKPNLKAKNENSNLWSWLLNLDC
jgi:hypothetical protein